MKARRAGNEEVYTEEDMARQDTSSQESQHAQEEVLITAGGDVPRLDGRVVRNLTGHKVTLLRKGDKSLFWKSDGMLRVASGPKTDGRTLVLKNGESSVRVSCYRPPLPTELYCQGFRPESITEEEVVIVSSSCGALLRDNPHLLPNARFVVSPLGANPVNGRKGAKTFAYWRGL